MKRSSTPQVSVGVSQRAKLERRSTAESPSRMHAELPWLNRPMSLMDSVTRTLRMVSSPRHWMKSSISPGEANSGVPVNTVRRWASNLRMRQSRSRPEIADRNASWSSLLSVVITPKTVVCLVSSVVGAALAVAFAVGCGDAVGGAARAVVGCGDAVVASVASRGAVGAVVELGAGSWAQARITTAYRARMAVNTLRAAGVIRLITSPRSVGRRNLRCRRLRGLSCSSAALPCRWWTGYASFERAWNFLVGLCRPILSGVQLPDFPFHCGGNYRGGPL